jgi:DNA replication protein DnaC
MLREPTISKLHQLRLPVMAATWQAQANDVALSELPFDERLALLVDAELLARDNLRLQRHLREAQLRITAACVEDIDYSAKRELDKALVRQLAGGRWLAEFHNLIISGKTGTGKTYLACALGMAAMRNGRRVIYRRAARLYDELAIAHGDGSYARYLAKLARVDLLIIDDFAMAPVTAVQRHDLLEIVEDRYGRASTLLAGQLDPKRYHDYLGDPTFADAFCDRLLHNAHRLVLNGPSRRKENASVR